MDTYRLNEMAHMQMSRGTDTVLDPEVHGEAAQCWIANRANVLEGS